VNDYSSSQLNSSGIRVHPCVGGFYLFPDFSGFKQKLNDRQIYTSSDLTTTIMDETGVALLRGSAFGMKKESLTVRLAFVDFDGSQILDEANDADFEKVKPGIDRLCSWVAGI